MGNNLNILILEDDVYFAQYITSLAEPFGKVLWCQNLSDFKSTLSQNPIDIVLADMKIGEEEEAGLIAIGSLPSRKKIHSMIISSCESEAVVEKAYQLGVHHFLRKDKIQHFLPNYLSSLIKRFVRNEIGTLLKEEFLTEDPFVTEQFYQLSQQNLMDQNVLITGPTGVGKTLLAEILHKLIYGIDKPFIALNCSEVAEDLLESELFGHKKGAFTGALDQRVGKLKEADGGTLFLDEVATMSSKMQQKLLKAIEEKTFYPLGSTKKETSKFTLIAATCEDLATLVKNKSFREDLFYRISGFNLYLPSLKERPNDIPLLIQHFLNQVPRKIILKPCAVKALSEFSWPGNIRELKKVIQVLSENSKGVVTKEVIHQVLKFTPTTPIQTSTLSYHQIQHQGLRSYLQDIERSAVKQAMDKHNGKITACIKELKISSSAFYRILQQV
jgi:DNA-binding NtrC family response regulator